MSGLATLEGFPVDLSLAYASDTHLWVATRPDGRLRIGMDALGVETAGTLAALELAPVGADLSAGVPFGSLEAAKFVGPLLMPVSGRVTGVNEAVVTDPSLAESDPYGAGWLIEIEPGAGSGPELARLVSGADTVSAWFTGEVADYRLQGVLAE